MTADMHTLTGAYAADALPDDERRAFEQHLDVCDACAQEVAELQETAARLAGAAEEPPPPDLKRRVLAELDRTRQEPPVTGRRDDGRADGGWAGRLLLPAAAVAAVVMLGVGVVIGAVAAQRSDDTTDRVVDLLTATDAEVVEAQGPAAARVRVVVSQDRGEAVLLAAGLEPAPEDRTYEAWFIGAGGASPAGLFDADEEGRAAEVLTGDLAGVEAIGVTIEPAGGSPQPTSDPIVVVELPS